MFCKFNRNDLQKISGVGKEEPKTTGEEYQNLGIPEPRHTNWSQASAALISFLGSPKLARLPASSQWRKVGGRRRREGEGTKCKFDRQPISSPGSGVLKKICLQD